MNDPLIVVCPHCDTANRVPGERMGQGPTCGRCKKSLFVGAPLELDGERFDLHAGRSDLPVVIDFWAPWCGPCRMMAPAFTEAARQLEPHYRLAKVNTEEEPELGQRFGIRSIPTLAVFRAGREVARQSGAMDAASLVRWIRST